jgi:hypothetical protein
MDVGIVVLCPDRNPAALKNTVGSVRYSLYNRDCIAVVPKDTSPKEIQECKTHCENIYKGKETITSLVNVGMKRLKQEWGFVVFAGSRVMHFLERKWDTFVKSDKDILYPIVDRKCNFVDGSFNGVLFNRKFYQEVGDIPDTPMEKPGLNDFEFAKLLWASDALNKGAIFKGIIGMRII